MLLISTIQNCKCPFSDGYTVTGKAIGFALEQSFHVVAFTYSASGILK
jgi:hypothetical protein